MVSEILHQQHSGSGDNVGRDKVIYNSELPNTVVSEHESFGFLWGLQTYYDCVNIHSNIENLGNGRERYFREKLDKNPRLKQDILKIFSGDSCFIQLIGKLEDLKEFITALFLLELERGDVRVYGKRESFRTICEEKNITNSFIITFANVLDLGILIKPLNNFVIILTESELDGYDYIHLKLDESRKIENENTINSKIYE